MSRSSHSQFCMDETECPGGNCEGCKDGARFCDDPRCSPNCKDCEQPSNAGLFVFIVIIIFVFVIIFVYVIWYRHMEVESADFPPKGGILSRKQSYIGTPSESMNCLPRDHCSKRYIYINAH